MFLPLEANQEVIDAWQCYPLVRFERCRYVLLNALVLVSVTQCYTVLHHVTLCNTVLHRVIKGAACVGSALTDGYKGC